MNMKENKTKISITVDPPTLDKITEMADHAIRPRSQYINLVLKIWADTDGLKNKELLEKLLIDYQYRP